MVRESHFLYYMLALLTYLVGWHDLACKNLLCFRFGIALC